MLNRILAGFYDRDIQQLIEEVNLFREEENLWKIHGSIKNSSGNLVLHIIGGMNFLIGTTLAKTGYVRNRDQEFTIKDRPREELITQLEALRVLISKTILSLTPEQMETDFPVFFDKPNTTISYVLTQLLVHLNYHLGQVNYLRRMLE